MAYRRRPTAYRPSSGAVYQNLHATGSEKYTAVGRYHASSLEVWPGYVTSIRQHEEQILLCCEISCKVLRTDTVLEQIEEVYKRTSGGANFKPSVEKALLGAIVITR